MRCLVLCILLAAPLLLRAQSSWNITAGGGIVMNSKTSSGGANEYMSKTPGGAAGLSVSYAHSRWEYGFGAAFRRYSLWHEGDYYFEDDFNPATGYSFPPRHLQFVEKLPAITVTPFINRHFNPNKKADWYAGVSAGWAVVYQKQTVYVSPDMTYVKTLPVTSGFTAGLQGGCAYRLGGAWSLRSEIAVDGLWLKAFSLQDAMLTAGIQYRIRQ